MSEVRSYLAPNDVESELRLRRRGRSQSNGFEVVGLLANGLHRIEVLQRTGQEGDALLAILDALPRSSLAQPHSFLDKAWYWLHDYNVLYEV